MRSALSSALSDVSRLAVSCVSFLPGCSHDVSPAKFCPPFRERLKKAPEKQPDLYERWLASRRCPKGGPDLLPPGSFRAFTSDNFALAYDLSKCCASEILSRLWELHPYRISLMIILDLVRGTLPAFRGYSQALMVDEVRRIVPGPCITAHPVIAAENNILWRLHVKPYHTSSSAGTNSHVHGSCR